MDTKSVLYPLRAAVAAISVHNHVLPTVGRAKADIRSPGCHPTPVALMDRNGVFIPMRPSPILRKSLRSFHSSNLSKLPVLYSCTSSSYRTSISFKSCNILPIAFLGFSVRSSLFAENADTTFLNNTCFLNSS